MRLLTIDDLREQYSVDGESPREVIEKSIDHIFEVNRGGGVMSVNNLITALVLAEQINYDEQVELIHYATRKYQELNR